MYGLAVKRLLEEYNLNANSVKGSGRSNRLLKGDVLSYIQQNNVAKIDLKKGLSFVIHCLCFVVFFKETLVFKL